MKHFLFIVILSTLLSGNIFAQRVVTGVVKNRHSSELIDLATVKNITKKFTTVTDSLGRFRIRANKGDSLIISSLMYGADSLVVGDPSSYDVNLTPRVNMLDPVTLKIINLKPIALPVSPFHGQRIVYQYNYGSKNIGGIAIRVWEGKQKSKETKLVKEQEFKENERLKAWFNADTLSKYIPLKGADMNRFIELYTPNAPEIRTYGGNLLLYINDNYKKFQALTPQQRYEK